MQSKFGIYVKSLPIKYITSATNTTTKTDRKADTKTDTKTSQIVIIAAILGIISLIIYGDREHKLLYKRLRSLKNSYKKGDPLPITIIPKVANKTELDLLHGCYNRFIRNPLLVVGNSGIGKTFIFQELVQNHRKKYGEAAYISLKYKEGKIGNLDAIEESMSKQLRVDYMTENKEWLKYKTTRKSLNWLWSIYNILDIIDDIQGLINPKKADNESWDAIYTTLGYLYDLAYEGYAILILGSSGANVRDVLPFVFLYQQQCFLDSPIHISD